jgi:NAD(P)-dependent dehydrogenase (short-subunit alcohol dehydrogenase family)
MTTWLVTGANRGIGLEIVRQAVKAGHQVIAAVRDPSSAAELAKIAAQGDVLTIALDVADPASIASAQQKLDARPIDLLVNNAGIIGPKRQSVFDMDFDGFAQTLAVNTLAPLRVTQAFLPNLEAARGAKVAAISSMMGSIASGGAYQIAYCASKAALNRVMRGLAAELKEKGIAVGIYSPGWVRTDMGGPGARLPVLESVAGLIRQFAALNLQTSGEFKNYEGKPVAW